MSTSTKKQKIAWLACTLCFVAIVAILLVDGIARSLLEEESAAIVCCFLPLSFVVLGVWGALLVKRTDEEREDRELGERLLVGRCQSCGYDTSGLEGCCPECAAPLTTAAWVPQPSATRTPSRSSFWTARRQGIAWCAAFLLIMTAFFILFLNAPPEAAMGLFVCMLPLTASAMLAWGIWIIWHWDDSSF